MGAQLAEFQSLFGLEARAAQDVIDPSGLVHSQALQSADGAFRVTINASDARETLSSRFLDHGFGGGYQHVALTTDDIFATAKGLQDNGAAMLEIPANYHADLAARFDLNDALAARRGAHGAGVWACRRKASNMISIHKGVEWSCCPPRCCFTRVCRVSALK